MSKLESSDQGRGQHGNTRFDEKEAVSQTPSATTKQKTVPSGMVVVHPHTPKLQKDLASISETTEVVHISGNPTCRNLIEEITTRAPRLHTLQITEAYYTDLELRRLRRLFGAKSVQVVIGNIRDMGYLRAGVRNSRTEERVDHFKTLPEDQRKRFDELCELGLIEALIVRRYCCFDGGPVISQRKAVDEIRRREKRTLGTSGQLCGPAVFAALSKYLDPTLKLPSKFKLRYEQLLRAIEKRHQAQTRLNVCEACAAECNRAQLPLGLPVRHKDRFEQVLELMNDPLMDRLAVIAPRKRLILLQHLGLEQWSKEKWLQPYRGYANIALQYNVTRERIRQVVNRALRELGILLLDEAGMAND